MATISEAELTAAQAEWAAIQATPVPMGNPALEAAAKIIEKWITFDLAQEIRFEINRDPESALEMLAEARRQTGADALAAALQNLVVRFGAKNPVNDDIVIEKARAALAAYERIVG